MPLDEGISDHLTAQMVAAYLDRRVNTSQRSTIEAHLADCRTCRREVVALTRVTRAGPSWRRYVLVPAAAAAAAAIVFLVAQPATQTDGGDPRFRGVGEGEAALQLTAFAPAQSQSVTPDSIRFIWGAASSEVAYRFTLTDEAGGVVWESGTTDTSLLLNSSVTLAPGGTYFWYVDALLLDGSSVTTGVRSLTVAQ